MTYAESWRVDANATERPCPRAAEPVRLLRHNHQFLALAGTVTANTWLLAPLPSLYGYRRAGQTMEPRGW